MNMRVISSVIAMASGLALAGPALADDVLTMKPRHGVSFDVGSKRAVGYYLAEGGICNLTVLMAESNQADSVKGAATRVTISVAPARAAHIDNAEGKSLVFACAPSAETMTVKVLDQVAFAQPRD